MFLLRAAGGAGWRYPVALLPVLPLGLAMAAYVGFLQRSDELQQDPARCTRLQLRRSALITISYGFLENVGLPQLSWVWVAPLMILLWGVGTFLASRRYS